MPPLAKNWSKNKGLNLQQMRTISVSSLTSIAECSRDSIKSNSPAIYLSVPTPPTASGKHLLQNYKITMKQLYFFKEILSLGTIFPHLRIKQITFYAIFMFTEAQLPNSIPHSWVPEIPQSTSSIQRSRTPYIQRSINNSRDPTIQNSWVPYYSPFACLSYITFLKILQPPSSTQILLPWGFDVLSSCGEYW